MKWFTLILVVGLLAWHGYAKHHGRPAEDFSSLDAVDSVERAQDVSGLDAADPIEPAALPSSSQKSTASSRFKCDGRTHCSQMTSCDEATFFLENCPDVEMDGDEDGVPCERQWCELQRP